MSCTGHDAVQLMPEEPASKLLHSGHLPDEISGLNWPRTVRGRYLRSQHCQRRPLNANEAQLTFHRQSRLGWAGHARGRGMAAGRHYNSQPGKWFLAL